MTKLTKKQAEKLGFVFTQYFHNGAYQASRIYRDSKGLLQMETFTALTVATILRRIAKTR